MGILPDVLPRLWLVRDSLEALDHETASMFWGGGTFFMTFSYHLSFHSISARWTTLFGAGMHPNFSGYNSQRPLIQSSLHN